MEDKRLKKRMYVFVERHLSPIDKGIQAAHAIVEYFNEAILWEKEKYINLYTEWANLDKTLILLNGGSVTELDNLIEELYNSNIHCGVFREPDLDNIVTAVSVIVDEQVFNTKPIPDFIEPSMFITSRATWSPELAQQVCIYKKSDIEKELEQKLIQYKNEYIDYVDNIGGIDNLKLKYLINNCKLAR